MFRNVPHDLYRHFSSLVDKHNSRQLIPQPTAHLQCMVNVHQPPLVFTVQCVCVCLSDFMSVSVCMHACISLSCDWLNDFLKGYRATISFWHLITVRSHCAPADPLWYGPCTCPSPLSQVPIIIIKLPTPTYLHLHLQPPTPSSAQPADGVWRKRRV